jgi:hypothetical protein
LGEDHERRKVPAKYERRLVTMEHVCSAPATKEAKGEPKRAVKKYSWENIPEEKKAKDKLHREVSIGQVEMAGSVRASSAKILPLE